MLITPESVRAILAGYTFTFTQERQLQDGIAVALELAGVTFSREHVLSAKDRIDFLIDRLGLEVKIGGSPTGLIRQIHRYAQHEALDAILVVVGRIRLAQLPETINGKPILTFDAVRRLW